MPYDYMTARQVFLTEEGSLQLIRRRDRVLELLRQSGAIRAEEAMGLMGPGDSWEKLATLDRMVEIGDLQELHRNTVAQHRIFTWGRGGGR